MYDRENSRVGFWKTNCSELSERLQSSAYPPPGSYNEAFAPSAQHDLHPGIRNGWFFNVNVSINPDITL